MSTNRSSGPKLILWQGSIPLDDYFPRGRSELLNSRAAYEWKAIVKTYLRPEMCDYPEHGCPLPALAPELARADPAMKAQIVEELVKYRDRMLPFMPGRCATDKERPFFAIFSTMIGATALSRILPAQARARVLASARDFLLRSFDHPWSAS
jgi:TetR/AcrR family transcriptional regulator, transcriptional repressor for nem operon